MYYAELDRITVREGTLLSVIDSALIHRMVHVLRLGLGQNCILFGKKQYAQVRLLGDAKVMIMQVQSVVLPMVPVTLILPVLKRDALEQALYSATELGAAAIQLVVTQKIDRQWVGEKELNRLQKIIIAAAEQSKNYAFPDIKKPIAWRDMLAFVQAEDQSYKMYGSFEGKSLLAVLKNDAKMPSRLFLTVGPEAGFTQVEERDLQHGNFAPCCLGTTTLRAFQAATVMLGVTLAYFQDPL